MQATTTHDRQVTCCHSAQLTSREVNCAELRLQKMRA
nr:MAG TPA: hypothetical protein [Microviridae sp.]